jgi:hypothetical protein
MSKTQSDHTVTPSSEKQAMLLLGTIGDTTWRMFVPTIGLTIAGLLVDKQLHTTPWVMVVGIVCGIFIAGMLVQQQLKKVNK